MSGFFLILNSVLRPFQDYFSSYETGQSVGGAKTGEPLEKPPDAPASRTWLVSCGQSGARTHTRHSGEIIEYEWFQASNAYNGIHTQSCKKIMPRNGAQIYLDIGLLYR